MNNLMLKKASIIIKKFWCVQEVLSKSSGRSHNLYLLTWMFKKMAKCTEVELSSGVMLYYELFTRFKTNTAGESIISQGVFEGILPSVGPCNKAF